MITRLGELLFVGFDGTELTVELRSFLGAIRPGGIILFKRNIADPDQTLRLIADLRGMFEPAPLIAVDEEGGQVSRMRPMAPTLPAAARLADSGNAATVRAVAASLGRLLASVGFDLDFAPVVDLCPPDAPNGIGDRSFGADPERACVMAGAYLDGLADAGITGCLKHFPGLGPTLFDSHHHLPTVQKEAGAFGREDLLPYRRLHPRCAAVMVGHGHYPFLSGADPIAATLSAPVVTGLLRDEIGFTGVALADDLEMKAVSARVPFSELAPRVVAAGCDMALVCRRRETIEAGLAGLEAWARSGRLPPSRIVEALSRVEALRAEVAHARSGGAAPSRASFRAACADLSSRIGSIA
jgi:beta-N-acetylhexosaminidase